jgi:hypothetical protein
MLKIYYQKHFIPFAVGFLIALKEIKFNYFSWISINQVAIKLWERLDEKKQNTLSTLTPTKNFIENTYNKESIMLAKEHAFI